MDYSTMKLALRDELSKIAGEMQGFTRIGRKPIGVERLLEKETESEIKPSDVAPAGAEKTSAISPAKKAIGFGIAGAGGYHLLRQANEDRKVGKMMRKQQG